MFVLVQFVDGFSYSRTYSIYSMRRFYLHSTVSVCVCVVTRGFMWFQNMPQLDFWNGVNTGVVSTIS